MKDYSRLIAAGFVELKGNKVVLSEKGKAALAWARAPNANTKFGPTAPIDSVRQRTRPPIKKKKHRK